MSGNLRLCDFGWSIEVADYDTRQTICGTQVCVYIYPYIYIFIFSLGSGAVRGSAEWREVGGGRALGEESFRVCGSG